MSRETLEALLNFVAEAPVSPEREALLFCLRQEIKFADEAGDMCGG